MAHRDKPLSADGYAETLKSLDRFLTKEEAALRGPLALDPRWRFHSPMQVEAGATLMKATGAAFHGLPFTPVLLADGKARLAELLAARQATEDNLARLDLAIVAQKNQLADWTGQLAEVTGHKIGDLTVGADDRAKLRRAAGPFFAISDHYNEVKTSATRRTRDLRRRAESAEDETSKQALEIKALKGEPLKVDELRPAAPRTAARRARKTRRA